MNSVSRYGIPGYNTNEDRDDFSDGDACHYCQGQGVGIVGTDWDCDDPINGPYPGEIKDCPCCGGSGSADDVRFW